VTRLPVISGRELIRALEKIGYKEDRQKGSHVVLRQVVEPYRRVTVPDHRELRKGTLRAIMRHIGLTTEELVSLLK
jgi:predicted RNA binding protein YcfA (HicA-like mRNA interferase family)